MRFLVLGTLALVVSVFISACGKKDDNKYSYEFSENGCSTGRHDFSSVAAMCDGLQDEGLNRGCALGSRVDYFEEKCGNEQFLFEEDHQGIGGDREHHHRRRRH